MPNPVTDAAMPDARRILAALSRSSHGPMKAKELARVLAVATEDYKGFRRVLSDLENEGHVYRVKGGRYAVPRKINLVVGILSIKRGGEGFLAPEDRSRDVFVPAAHQASAMDGDRVVVRIEARPKGQNPVGSVVKVLIRAHPAVVGTYRAGRRFGYVEPQSRKLTRDVLIPDGEAMEAEDGDVVMAEISAYGDRKLNPVGRVTRILGKQGAPGVDVLSILHGYGLPLEFPPEVEEEAKAAALLPIVPSPGRVDHRDLVVFTIDPADAKDHDDALSIVPRGEEGWEVGIHIADVSQYVAAGSALDVEAMTRGTSVYLVDRVVPMLPHALSSSVCSLVPGEDRYAVSLFAVLDTQGQVGSHRFERTLIRSRSRLSYEDAQALLDGSGPDDSEITASLQQLDALARVLRAKREARGSIDFDLPESRVILGSGGEPVDIQRVLRLGSHRLIEDFMLLANEIVATESTRRRLPILYRVHEPPTAVKLEALREFVTALGLTLPRGDIRPVHLQSLANQVSGTPEQNLVSTVLLRSMQRARYSASNLGHFGLAAENYCHFTSPIRRYPDLVTHRAVVQALIEQRPSGKPPLDLDGIADGASATEQVAAAAERDSVDLKKVQFMERHLGESFEGTVSGVTSFGFFVLLDQYFVEGLVHVSGLQDDYYEFRGEEYALVGSRRGRRFRLGDRVEVEVTRLDRAERRIDFGLSNETPRAVRPRRR